MDGKPKRERFSHLDLQTGRSSFFGRCFLILIVPELFLSLKVEASEPESKSLPAPPVAAFRPAATDRSSPAPLPGLLVCAPAVVPGESFVLQRPRSPAASPNARSRHSDSVDGEVLRDGSLRFPEWPAGSAAPLGPSVLPPALASPPIPPPSAKVPVATNLALGRSQTCDWTCELASGISFSRRLSPLKRDSQPGLYPSSGESRCFFFSSFN